MLRRISALTLALVCGAGWVIPEPVRAASRTERAGPPPPPPQTAEQAEAEPMPSMPSSPCSAWSSDPAVLTPAPEVCLNYISSLGNAKLKLQAPMMSKVPQDPELVAEFAGVRGDTATQTFEVEGPWRLDWESDSDFMLTELRSGPMGQETVQRLPRMNMPGQKSQAFRQGGTFYLNVRSDGPWRARVTLAARSYNYDYDIAASSELVNPVAFPVLITYSFGEGRREEVTLQPGQRLRIAGNIALTDYTEPRSAQQLREDFPGLLIHSVDNASTMALRKRREQDRQARDRKLDPQGQRKAARSELQHAAVGEQRRKREDSLQKDQLVAQQVADNDRSWKRSWGAAGVVTLVAGVGVGTTLIVLGGTKLPVAQEELDRALFEQAMMGDEPSPNILVEVGRRNKEVSEARNTLTTGIIVAAAGAAIGATLLVVANRVPSKRRKKDPAGGYAWGAGPQFGRWGASAWMKF